MPQGDMSFETFAEILDRHIARYGMPLYVSLQGEGEPTLHRDFFRMAEHVRAKGSQPYTITNGTSKHPERFIGLFERIGISVDTLDPARAEKIGRYNLPAVLSFIDALAPHMQIIIHSVLLGPDIQNVAHWCLSRGFEHIVLPLQGKDDYRRHYPKLSLPDFKPERFACPWLQTQRMRFYTLDQQELPCCFIKDVTAYPGLDGMFAHQQAGTWPAPCRGCQHGRAETPARQEAPA